MSALVLQWSEWNDVLSYLGEAKSQKCSCYCTMRCVTLKQAANAGNRLSAHGMILLLEYLPQEPSDPVYGKLMSGGSAYEWEAQSQYRASHCCLITEHNGFCVQSVAAVVLLNEVQGSDFNNARGDSCPSTGAIFD